MTRRREREPKIRQLCLRLTDRQFKILEQYALIKDMDTEVDAVRHIIDGLASWLAKREAGVPPVSDEAPRTSVDPTDVAPTDVAPIDIADGASNDVIEEDDDDTPTLGDFGGHPSLGLPGNPSE